MKYRIIFHFVWYLLIVPVFGSTAFLTVVYLRQMGFGIFQAIGTGFLCSLISVVLGTPVTFFVALFMLPVVILSSGGREQWLHMLAIPLLAVHSVPWEGELVSSEMPAAVLVLVAVSFITVAVYRYSLVSSDRSGSDREEL